jgi:hypothetical protein
VEQVDVPPSKSEKFSPSEATPAGEQNEGPESLIHGVGQRRYLRDSRDRRIRRCGSVLTFGASLSASVA